MNNLPVIHETGVELSLGTASLEEIRNKALRNIEADPTLPEYRKQAVIRELDFLIKLERLRRLRKFAFQWAEEKEAFRNSIFSKRIELANNIRLAVKQTDLQIAQLNREILNCKLDVIERIRRLRPKDDSAAYLKKAALELQKLRLQKLIMQAREDMFHQNLTDRTLNRQKFYDRVRKLYPDVADDLMDYYDRQVFEQTLRRQ
jgi:hypothetical protein